MTTIENKNITPNWTSEKFDYSEWEKVDWKKLEENISNSSTNSNIDNNNNEVNNDDNNYDNNDDINDDNNEVKKHYNRLNNHYKSWSKNEEEDLINSLKELTYNDTKKIKIIANIHKRTYNSIKCRINKLILDEYNKKQNNIINEISKKFNINNNEIMKIINNKKNNKNELDKDKEIIELKNNIIILQEKLIKEYEKKF